MCNNFTKTDRLSIAYADTISPRASEASTCGCEARNVELSPSKTNVGFACVTADNEDEKGNSHVW